MARPQSRGHDGHGARFLRADLGSARATGSATAKTMKLLITGVSHKTAPVEVRERLAFREDTLGAALADLKSRPGVSEAFILSTCNRVEIALTTDDSTNPAAVVDSFLVENRAARLEGLAPLL